MKVRDIKISIVKSDIASLPDGVIGITFNEGLIKSGKVDEFTVRAACRGSITRALQESLSSVALPAFGCGEGKFPLIACAKIMSQELLRAGREAKGTDALKEIMICLATDEELRLFEAQVYGYLRHVMQDLGWGPYVTTDIIIEVEGGIILIERTNPPFGWALPGGFVDRGESLETAARREAKEETDMDLENLKQFHTYSDPSRDPRFHTVTTVFTAKGVGKPCAGDDAKGIKVIALSDLRKHAYAFDHATVINDYLKSIGL